ncbi:ABC transporter permease [Pseudodesulfovibrio sp.]|uniref:ABC transporter permease n=1 Tax=unclassified Pseudodesulfovibrio TaxID=2661612 RepID=UPI003B00C90E
MRLDRETKRKLRKLFTNPTAVIGFALLLFFVLVAIFAPLLAPPTEGISPYIIPRHGFLTTPKPPTADLIFGTTEGQYDIYYACVWGTRTAFAVGFAVVLTTTLIGIILGSISGYFRGKIDECIMRVTDIFMSIPFLIAVMVLTTLLGKGLDKVVIALIAFDWMDTARLIRGNIMQAREEEYIQAARALGFSNMRIICNHLLPNTIFPVIIQASMRIGTLVVTASALSFLGLGASQDYADWGQIISYSRNWQGLEYWYAVFFPALAMVLFVLSWNLIGDALRDVFDPKIKA